MRQLFNDAVSASLVVYCRMEWHDDDDDES
jgi:hypothetical protein